MVIPVYITKTLATAADDDGVSLSQTPGAAGDLTITGALASGGVATFDARRRVLVTTASDESGKTLTIYGTDKVTAGGNPIYETMTGPNATTGYTTRDFGTVTRVAVSAAFTGAVKVGTNGIGSTQWFLPDFYLTPLNLSIGVVVTGSVNYTVQYTYDNYWTLTPGLTQATVPTTWNDPTLAAVTTTGDTTYTNPITGWRVLINSGTGSLAIKGIQAGMTQG